MIKRDTSHCKPPQLLKHAKERNTLFKTHELWKHIVLLCLWIIYIHIIKYILHANKMAFLVFTWNLVSSTSPFSLLLFVPLFSIFHKTSMTCNDLRLVWVIYRIYHVHNYRCNLKSFGNFLTQLWPKIAGRSRYK